MTFGSLFAGIGGFDLGLERAGHECRWQVEIDPFCRQVLAKHWPDVPRHDDIKTFPTAQGDWRVDCIVGGFPCQDISYAGRGAGIEGKRSGLFFELARVVRVLEPRIVVLENVAALLNRGLDRVLGTLASLGFDAEWDCIPAAAVGAPHRRDRAFVVAYAGGLNELGMQNKNGKKLDDRSFAADCIGSAGAADGAAYSHVLRADRSLSGRVDFKDDAAGLIWPTLTKRWDPEPDVDRVVDGLSFPMDRYRGLGNAVVPQVAEYIGNVLHQLDVNRS